MFQKQGEKLARALPDGQMGGLNISHREQRELTRKSLVPLVVVSRCDRGTPKLVERAAQLLSKSRIAGATAEAAFET